MVFMNILFENEKTGEYVMLSNQRDNRKIIESIAFKAENTKACHQRYDGSGQLRKQLFMTGVPHLLRQNPIYADLLDSIF